MFVFGKRESERKREIERRRLLGLGVLCQQYDLTLAAHNIACVAFSNSYTKSKP